MRTFIVILLGQVVSLLGSSLSQFALGIWVYQTTGSVTQYALAAFFAVAPPVVLSPLLGSLVDRWEKRWAMILGDAGAGVAMLALALLMWSGKAELWHLYLAVASNAAFGALQYPTFSAATTLLVPRDKLSRANGMVQFGIAAASLLAPLLAGVLVQAIQVRGVLLIDFASCAFAVLSLLVIRIPRPERKSDPAAGRRSVLAESADGWIYIRNRPGLLGLLLLFALINFAIGMVETLITPMVLSFASAAVLGTVVSGAGAGMLAGGLLMAFWKGPEQRVRAILATLALQGATLLLGGLRPDALLIATAAFLYLACVPVINACSQTVWQSKVPPSMQGRVFAIRQMVATSSLPLSTLVAGPLADGVFEPLLAPGGALAASAGRLIGVGAGRGIALLLIVLGSGILLAAAISCRRSSLRNVESELPDALPQMT